MLDRAALLKEINEASFAVTDLTLYLDTHPTDKDALGFFTTCMDKRKKAMQEYEAKFEPLMVDCVNPAGNNSTNSMTNYPEEDHWTWSDGPLPWDPFGSD